MPEKNIAEHLREAIENALSSAVELQTGETPPPITESTVVVGVGGILDSMGFVNFVVALEAALEERSGRSIDVIGLLQNEDAAHANTVGALIQLLSAA